MFLCFLLCIDERDNFFVRFVSPVVPLRDLEPRGIEFGCEAPAANASLFSDKTIPNGHYRFLCSLP